MTRPDLVELDSPQAAALLTLERLRMVAPFIARPCTLSEGASAAQVPLSTVTRWVKRFVEAGVLIPVSELGVPEGVQPSARPTPETGSSARRRLERYTLAARRVLVVMPRVETTLEESLKLHAPKWERFLQSVELESARYNEPYAISLMSPETGSVRIGSAPLSFWRAQGKEEEVPLRLMHTWGEAPLNGEEAKQLLRELDALLTRFTENRSEEGRQMYLLHLGLVADHG